MKFNEKYPDQTNAQKVYPDRLLGPHPALLVREGLEQSWRCYPCSSCGIPTSWRLLVDGMGIAVCSDECEAQVLEAETPTPAATRVDYPF